MSRGGATGSVSPAVRGRAVCGCGAICHSGCQAPDIPGQAGGRCPPRAVEVGESLCGLLLARAQACDLIMTSDRCQGGRYMG